jgi:LPXTG-motif cell wall-anchored protein
VELPRTGATPLLALGALLLLGAGLGARRFSQR